MKTKLKLAFLLILISIAAVFVSCSKEDDPSNTPAPADVKTPVLGQLSVVSVTSTTARIKVPVTSTGNYPLTQRGLIFGAGVPSQPVIAGVTGTGSIKLALVSSSDNEFVVDASGLTPSWTYTIRGWASNQWVTTQYYQTPTGSVKTAGN